MARRFKQKNALNSLRVLQTLGSIAAPNTLEKVTEEIENKPEPEIFGNDDWKSVEQAVCDIFRKDSLLSESGILYGLHQNIKNILRSRTGTFLCDCYKEWLIKEMNMQAVPLRKLKGLALLQCLKEKWKTFYSKILPLLEAVFFSLKPKRRLSVRDTALVVFRDVVFFTANIEESIKKEREYSTKEMRQMVFILYSVNDNYPPSKNRLRLEALAAILCPTFMGYLGLYEKGKLIVRSNEPATMAKRRPSEIGPRRISRPFSVQPQQMETLDQLFKNAVRHKTQRDGVRGQFQKNLRIL